MSLLQLQVELEEEFQVNIKVFSDNSKACKHKRAIAGYTCALTAVHLATDIKLQYVSKYTAHLETSLKEIRLEAHSKFRILKVRRLDNQFVTDPITLWVLESNMKILPCIPYEHHFIGDTDRFNPTLEGGIVKLL